ncbi:phage tail spike protein [Enterococcus rotai]|uniref:phage tail spike protein n=1 Tax=Enterococcus rotai TaxID=118060 RepID=UPI0032B38B16
MSHPILYDYGTTNYFNLGLGVLSEAVTAQVHEARTLEYYFEMSYPIDSWMYKFLQVDREIKCDNGHTLKDQRFVIKRIIDDATEGYATVYAEHVSYLTNDLPLKPYVYASGSCQIALNIWKSAIVEKNPFVVDSDITTNTATTWEITNVENSRQALGGVEGSMLDRWGGEFRFDNYHISLLKARGKRSSSILAYGKNIIDLEQERNITNTFTSVYPYATYKDEKENEVYMSLPEFYVDSEHVSKYKNRKILPVDFSNEFDDEKNRPTVAKLRELAKKYIKSNNVGIPNVSIRVSFLDLSQTVDYKHVAPLEELNLCDTVTIFYEKLGISTTAKVIRTVWNVLLDRYDEIEIGDSRTTLAGTINNIQNNINEIQTNVNEVQTAANGKNTIFRGPDEPKANHIGDMWYKPVGDEVEFYIWDGVKWEFIMSTAGITEAKKIGEEAREIADAAQASANAGVSLANQAILNANLIKNELNTLENEFDGFQQSVFGANGLSSQITQLAGQVTSVVTDLGDLTSNTNLIPYWESGSIYTNTGTDYDSVGMIRTPFIKVEPNSVYIGGEDTGQSTYFYFYYYDSERKFISGETVLGSIITPANAAYIRLRKTTSIKPEKAKFTFQEGTERHKFSVLNTQSQYTQLSTMINLRVQKGDVLGQINLEAGTTLIQQTGDSGKIILDAATVHFTGKAFIPSAAITELVADKLTVGSTLNAANVNVINLNAYNISSGFINSARISSRSITANHLAADAIRVGFNAMGNTMQLDAWSLSLLNSGKKTMSLTSRGINFWDGSVDIGWIGKNNILGKPTVRGLDFDLEYYGDYMTWAYRTSPSASTYGMMLTMDARGKVYGEVGLHLGTKMICHNWDIKGGFLRDMGVNGKFTVYNNVNLQFYSNLNMNGYSITNQSGFSLKTQFEDINPENSLKYITETDIVSYVYKENPNARKVGFVINDTGSSPYYTAPELIVDGRYRDDAIIVGHLMNSTKALANEQKTQRTLIDNVSSRLSLDEIKIIKLEEKVRSLENKIQEMSGAA